jgi:OmpA-OmpF porin, OOP family
MKKIFIFTALCVLTLFSNGQILKKVTDKVKNKIDPSVNKPVSETTTAKNDEKVQAVDTNKTQQAAVGIKAYSKYDFVPGERIIVFEDFAQDAVGDFPDKWNTNVSAEIVTIESLEGKWLKINKQGVFMPEFIDSLPDNFTFEYDLLCDNPGKVWGYYTTLGALSDRNHPEHWQSANSRFTFTVAAYPDGNSTSMIERRKDGAAESSISTGTKQFSDKTKPVHVALWRQKERVRVYFNQEKVWDIPKALSQTSLYNSIVYWLQGGTDDGNFYLSNLRLAVGMPDTRNKILTQNKWVTHGILFDVNSATIKPESYGTLKEMANVLNEYADLKVKIVGHTDADGSDASNLELSKKRAASVKEALTKEFGIDTGRMEADGKGESEPIDKNDNPAGKANNRRVEFIKI